jgi:hypothetical protein
VLILCASDTLEVTEALGGAPELRDEQKRVQLGSDVEGARRQQRPGAQQPPEEDRVGAEEGEGAQYQRLPPDAIGIAGIELDDNADEQRGCYVDIGKVIRAQALDEQRVADGLDDVLGGDDQSCCISNQRARRVDGFRVWHPQAT